MNTGEQREVDVIKKILTERPFCTFNVLGEEAAAGAKRMIAANFSEIDQKRIKIRVHK